FPGIARWRSTPKATSLRCRETFLRIGVLIAEDRRGLFWDAENVPAPGELARRDKTRPPGHHRREGQAEHDRRQPQEGLAGDEKGQHADEDAEYHVPSMLVEQLVERRRFLGALLR